MQTSRSHKGYSLIEVLVAVAILMFSIVGPMTIASKSIQSSQFTKQQTTAFFLAQEGISMTENIRNYFALQAYAGPADPWSGWATYAPFAPCKTATGCNFSLNDIGGEGNFVTCTANTLPDACTLYFNAANQSGAVQPYHTRAAKGDPRSIYKRTITWKVLNANEILVTSKVEWNSILFGGIQNVSLSTSLLNKYKAL